MKKFGETLQREEGKDLCFFTYILLDPHLLHPKDEGEAFDLPKFLEAVFYTAVLKSVDKENKEKRQRIKQIWDRERGVILHIFLTGKSQGKAKDRESLMIDAIRSTKVSTNPTES